MIPASYFYKDMYTRNWGDPGNQRAEAIESERRGPSKGHLAGIAGLLATVLPLELDRYRRVRRA
jgi:hypothetical protein